LTADDLSLLEVFPGLCGDQLRYRFRDVAMLVRLRNEPAAAGQSAFVDRNMA
jgi:hypothetical protein